MYQVSIFNKINGEIKETTIHQSAADDKAPHLLSLNLQEKLSIVSNLTFDIPSMNPGYDLIQALTTKIKVIKEKDNSVVFSGRILTISDEMGSDGIFKKTVICEDALAYLTDSNADQTTFANMTPTQILTTLINSHNAQVSDVSKTIELGIVELNQPVTICTNYESILNVIIKNLVNILGGDIRVQERNGLLYFDYLLDQGKNNDVKIQLGRNQQSLVVKYDPTGIATRLIPLGYGEGINQLNIKSVNNGLKYIDNLDAQVKYGIITKAVANKDIQDASTLKNWGQTYIKQNSQPLMEVEADMLDLSTIGLDKPVSLGDTIEAINGIMNFDVFARIIEKDTNLLAAYNPKLTLNTKPISLSNQQIDIQQRLASVENAPQGNTCIFALTKAENADSSHPITFDLDIPNEAININRVYINLHGRPYRAYEKDTASGGGSTQTSSSGGGTTSSNGGDHRHVMFLANGEPSSIATNGSWNAKGNNGENTIINLNTADIDLTEISTYGSSGTHSHTIGSHSHEVTIPSHTHSQNYGIYESTYPKNVKIRLNGNDIGINYGDGTNSIDEYNIDITPHISVGNNKIEISTEQNGRIEAIVYSQIFIQSK